MNGSNPFKEPFTWVLLGYMVVWIVTFGINRDLWVIVTGIGLVAFILMWAQDQYQTRRRK